MPLIRWYGCIDDCFSLELWYRSMYCLFASFCCPCVCYSMIHSIRHVYHCLCLLSKSIVQVPIYVVLYSMMMYVGLWLELSFSCRCLSREHVDLISSTWMCMIWKESFCTLICHLGCNLPFTEAWHVWYLVYVWDWMEVLISDHIMSGD